MCDFCVCVCVKLTVAVRVGGLDGTRVTAATVVAAATEAGAGAATIAAAAAAATTAVVATTVAAEADLLVWGKSHCATGPLRYLKVLWKMMMIQVSHSVEPLHGGRPFAPGISVLARFWVYCARLSTSSVHTTWGLKVHFWIWSSSSL